MPRRPLRLPYKSKRSGESCKRGYFVCHRETAPIRIPPHLLSWNGRFQRSDWKHQWTFVCRCETAPIRIPPHLLSWNERFQRELEASMDPFTVAQEGVAPSPSPLVKSKRSANRYLFTVGKPLPFASQLHLFCCNERFQQRAGTINPQIFSCKRGRRCLVSLSARKKQRSANRYLFAVVKLLLFASPPAFVELEWTLPATSWKHQWTHLQLHKRATLPCRSLRHEQTKQSQAGNLFPYVRCPTSHTSYVK